MMVSMAYADGPLFKFGRDLNIEVFDDSMICRQEGVQADFIPVIPKVPGDFPHFFDKCGDPGFTRLTPFQPFKVLLLNVLSSDTHFAHRQIVTANCVLLNKSLLKAIAFGCGAV